MGRSLKVGIESWPLARPFRISRGVKTAAEVISVTLHEQVATGRGEAVPYSRYDETPASVAAQISSVAAAIEAGADRAALARLLAPGAARNALDCALWDLEAALTGQRVTDRIGLAAPRQVATALTISLDTPAQMGEAAARLEAPLLKVKLDAHLVKERLQAVRAAAPTARLIIDPNEGWRIDDLIAHTETLRAAQVAFVEQPLPAGEDEALAAYRGGIALCADESVHTLADLEALVGRYQIVNIKLDKAGGLTEAARLLLAARTAGFRVMIGCMVCSSLAVAPAFLLAGGADYVDLDGPLWLSADRPGGLIEQGGMIAFQRADFWG
jgi:L-alanine-DL-glutamate epimerase-like enolase superfamily enzyme